jgi:hypothetical protein
VLRDLLGSGEGRMRGTAVRWVLVMEKKTTRKRIRRRSWRCGRRMRCCSGWRKMRATERRVIAKAMMRMTGWLLMGDGRLYDL